MNRCMALINSQALLKNLALIRASAPNNKIIVMVKANGYGHGLLEIASILNNQPDIALGVAALKEALLLRQHNITNQIFLFDGGAFVGNARDIFQHKITPVVSTLRALHDLLEESNNCSKELLLHLKIDTGFTRNGLAYHDILSKRHDNEFSLLQKNHKIHLEGIATHFCLADYPHSDFTSLQMQRFEACISYLLDKNFSFTHVHFSNSAAILRGISLSPKIQHLKILNRPGLLAYGISPLDEKTEFTPVMSIKAQIVAIKDLPAGAGVGYGHTYHTTSPRTVGVIAMGYGDGLRRALSNRAAVLINGQEAPLIGTISMDSCVVDITGIENVKEGDMATLIGQDGTKTIRAEQWASLSDTIVWEILTSITARLDRIVT